MLPVVFAVIGILIGGPVLGEWFGSGLAGLCLGLVVELRRRLNVLEPAVEVLRERVKTLEGRLREGDVEPLILDDAFLDQIADSPSAPPFAPASTPKRPAADAPVGGGHGENPSVPRASAPSAPTLIDQLWTRVRDWVLGGNPMVRAGVVVLFFGVAFLLKLAADNALFPIELRLAGVAVGGIVLLVLGWRQRESRPHYGLALQGGAVGMLYLTVFAGLRLYQLIPPGLAFGALAVLAAFSAVLAVAQNASVLAMLGAAGGFLAPVLASTGEGSHVALFSYYLVINLGILGIAWFRPWRVLNLVGFGFTFVISSFWGYRFYRPEFFASTEPFLCAFVALYVAIAVLFARRQPSARRGWVDTSLVFGVPLVGFALQAGLVRGMEYGLAWSSLAAAAFYIAVAGIGFARWGAALRLLAESFLAIGVLFATLTVPLALDARWTAGMWALEGAALVWVGGRQGRLAPRLFGYLLQIGAAVALLRAAFEAPPNLPVLNGVFVGAIIVAIAGLYIAWQIRRHPDWPEWERRLYLSLLVWGLAWWYGAWVAEIYYHLYPEQRLVVALALYFTASSLFIDGLRRRLHWGDLRYPALSLLPLLILLLDPTLQLLAHPFADWTLVGWTAGLVGQLYLLHRAESQDEVGGQGGRSQAFAGLSIGWLHQAGLWLALFLVAWESAWWLDRLVHGADTWSYIPWALVPALAMLALRPGGLTMPWPVAAHPRIYRIQALIPLGFFLWGWVLLVCLGSRGGSDPLPYLPLLNPLDLVIGFVLLVLIGWLYRVESGDRDGSRTWRYSFAPWGLGATLFIWINSAWFRTSYHWLGVSFSLDAMLDSQIVQTGLSVLWALGGLAGMLLGNRMAQRQVWFAGAGLMAAVVTKLFLADLSGSGTLERIVSFLSVGVLLLVVGYFAPLPPRRKTAADADRRSKE